MVVQQNTMVLPHSLVDPVNPCNRTLLTLARLGQVETSEGLEKRIAGFRADRHRPDPTSSSRQAVHAASKHIGMFTVFMYY